MRQLVVACGLVLALSGCGVKDDRSDVRAVTGRFIAALNAGNGGAACAQLDTDVQAALTQQEGKSCPRAIGGSVDPPKGSVEDVRVYAFSAIVHFSSHEALFFSKGSDGWLISAVGCKPQ